MKRLYNVTKDSFMDAIAFQSSATKENVNVVAIDRWCIIVDTDPETHSTILKELKHSFNEEDLVSLAIH